MEHKFSPSYVLSQINRGNVIKAFKERIENYYFKPIKKLLNKQDFGFAATTLLASLIDIFTKTQNHDTTNEKNRKKYIEWIEENLGFDTGLATFFYENFRCGLLHAGCIESSGQISYSQKQLWTDDKSHIIMNPKSLFQKLKMIFNNLIANEDPNKLFTYLKERVSEINQSTN